MFQCQNGKTVMVFSEYRTEVIVIPPFLGNTKDEFITYLQTLNQQECIAALNADNFSFNVGKCAIDSIPYVTIVEWAKRTRFWLLTTPTMKEIWKTRPQGQITYETSFENMNKHVMFTVDEMSFYNHVSEPVVPTPKQDHQQLTPIASTLNMVRKTYPRYDLELDCSDPLNFEKTSFLHEWMAAEYPNHIKEALNVLNHIEDPGPIIELGAGPSVMQPIAKEFNLKIISNDINDKMITLADSLGHVVNKRSNTSVIGQNHAGTYWLLYQLSEQPCLIPNIMKSNPDASIVVIDTTDDFIGRELMTRVGTGHVYTRNVRLVKSLHTDLKPNMTGFAWTNKLNTDDIYCVTSIASAALVRRMQRTGMNVKVCFVPGRRYGDIMNVYPHTKHSVFLLDNNFRPNYDVYLSLKDGSEFVYRAMNLNRPDVHVYKGTFIYTEHSIPGMHNVKRKLKNYISATHSAKFDLCINGSRKIVNLHVYRETDCTEVAQLIKTQSNDHITYNTHYAELVERDKKT